MKQYFFILLFFSQILQAQSIFEQENLQKYSGLFSSFYDEEEGKLYLEVEHLDSSFLYVSSLSEGLGSNDLFLDRGQIGNTRVVKFKKFGNKLMLIQPNLDYRAITTNQLERTSVEEAFAKSVIYGFEIIEHTNKGYLIDITDFLLQDTHGVLDKLKWNKQGSYSFDKSRSAFNMERTKSFPKNVEFDVLITLKGKPNSNQIESVTPDAQYVSMFQHHSFIELPDEQFKPRKAHPNSGSITTSFMNYSADISEPLLVEYVNRHRLEKKKSTTPIKEAVEPIIYYLDNGTPEPIRSALIEGASWWNEAFEVLGYKDAFQVKILPDTVDPLDVRYNVIQWVHRSTRGWSYGGGVVDPRTGEIIKGHVSLGSLRIKQDYNIARALINGRSQEEAEEFALARIRQLGAHEVGHTLGFSHNFAASTNNRASVMDYPHPLVTIEDGEIDLSNAYASGIGDWDMLTVSYSYGYFKDEEKDLSMLMKNVMDHYRFISDGDARPIGSANIHGHLWDNGEHPVEELHNVIAVRNLAIQNFNSEVLKDGESFAELEDLFVLLYYYHRYQVEAAIKVIGGREYSFGLKGEISSPGKAVNEQQQIEALAAIMKCLEAQFLAIPKNKLDLFPDRAYWQGRGRESFDSKTGPSFDPFTAVESATNFVLERLLHPHRVNRLISQAAIDKDQLSLESTIHILFNDRDNQYKANSYLHHVELVIQQTIMQYLMVLSQQSELYPQAKSIIQNKLSEYANALEADNNLTSLEKYQLKSIQHFLEHPQEELQWNEVTVPDGSPIGCEG